MKKITICCSCVFISLFLLSSCNISDAKSNYSVNIELTPSEYSISEFNDYIIPFTLPTPLLNNFSYSPNINDVVNLITETTYSSETQNGGMKYSILKFKDSNNYLFLLYKNDGEIIDSIFTSKFYSLLDFAKIWPYISTLEDVNKIDINAKYYYKANESYSIHWLKNGFFIVVLYDENEVVKFVKVMKDNTNFYKILKSAKCIEP